MASKLIKTAGVAHSILCVGYGLDIAGFESPQRQRNFLYSKTSKPHLGAHPACRLRNTLVFTGGKETRA